MRSCCKGQGLAERQGNLEGHTRWCFGSGGLGEHLFQSKKYRVVVEIHKIISKYAVEKYQSRLLNHTANSDVCF